MKFNNQFLITIISLLIIPNFLIATDYVHPSEYMDPDGNDDSFSLFPIIAIGVVIYAGYKMFKFFESSKDKLTGFDKFIVAICGLSILLLAIGFFSVPYEYYIFLRYAISISAIACLIHELQNPEEHFWKVYFIIILIIHNPIFPIYLYYKTIWLIVDTLFGLVFVAKISKFIEKAEN